MIARADVKVPRMVATSIEPPVALLPADRVILSLCDESGNWPRYYREAGYDVRSVDLKRGDDVRLMEFPGHVHGVLAAPPCTVFAKGGFRWSRTDAEIAEGLSVVDACLRLVALTRPVWWALENPEGHLRKYLGPPRLAFNPCDFGDAYTKRTLLWGSFAVPSRTPVAVTRDGVSWAEKLGGSGEARRAARSATPLGFARAFFEANP